jgi:hypothetical protein
MELGFSLSSEEHDQGAQILEVLPAADYDWKHVAGAVESAFVPDSGGRLWGLVSRADLERALGGERPR